MSLSRHVCCLSLLVVIFAWADDEEEGRILEVPAEYASDALKCTEYVMRSDLSVEVPMSLNRRRRHPHDRLMADVVIFNTELPTLEIRWEELDSVVDYFVVVEANLSFSGLPKPLHFAEAVASGQFPIGKRLAHKIVTVDCSARLGAIPSHPSDFANRDAPDVSQRAWRREFEMRECARNALRGASPHIHKHDLVLFSDADEIVAERAARAVKWCANRFPDTFFVGDSDHLGCAGPRYIFGFRYIDAWFPTADRYASVFTNHQTWWHKGPLATRILSDVAPRLSELCQWHCGMCFMGDVDMYKNKYSRWADSAVCWNTDHWPIPTTTGRGVVCPPYDDARIRHALTDCETSWLANRCTKVAPGSEASHLPRFVRENALARYRDFVPRLDVVSSKTRD